MGMGADGGTGASGGGAYVAPDTVIECVPPTRICAAPAPVTEYAPTAAYAAPRRPPLNLGRRRRTDAPYTTETDTVFVALVELVGEDGRDWVLVRHIQAQTSLQLERLEELFEEWECREACAGMTRDSRWHSDCRSRMLWMTSIDARLTCTNREVQSGF